MSMEDMNNYHKEHTTIEKEHLSCEAMDTMVGGKKRVAIILH